MKITSPRFAATRRIIPVAAISCLLALLGAGFGAMAERLFAATAAAANGPFRTDPAALARLSSAPTKLGSFGAMRLPPGYTLQPYPTPGGAPGAQSFLFSKANPDGTRPVFFVLIAPIPAAAKGQNEQILDSAVAASIVPLRRAWTNFHMSPVVNGKIAGGPAKYVLYSGIAAEPVYSKPRQASAACYFACVGNIVIGVTSRDTAPYDVQSRRVAEAAVLSFTPQGD